MVVMTSKLGDGTSIEGTVRKMVKNGKIERRIIVTLDVTVNGSALGISCPRQPVNVALE